MSGTRPGGGAGAPGAKPMTFWPSAGRLVARLSPDRARVAGIVALAVVSVGLTVLGPWLLGKATDTIFAGVLGRGLAAGTTNAQAVAAARAAGDAGRADLISGSGAVPGQGIDFSRLATIVLLALGAYLVGSLVAWWQGWLLNGVIQRTVNRLRSDVEATINRLPLTYFDARPRGELLSRVTNDLDNVGQSLQQTLSQLLTSALTVVGVLVMMLVISPLLALVALVAVPLALGITTVVARRSQPQFVAQWASTGRLNAEVEETFTGHELVAVFGQQGAAQDRFEAQNQALYRAAFGAQFVSGLIQPLMLFVGNLSYVAIAVVGGLRVASGTISLGDVQAFIQYSRQFTQPLAQVAALANTLQSGVASAERVFEVLDAPEQRPDPVGAAVAAPVQGPPCGRVTFEDVSFSYDPAVPLIEHLSLVAEPGQTVAVVGPTGAGKTTLVNLVMRFYEVGSGRITLDGRDIAAMPRAELRSQIGMVLQDTWLFGGTIRENIAYGRLGATEEEILAAARATYVDRFVRSLPDGYDTVVDEAGDSISSGEQQLITIARAFLAQPLLLILDEATSSVDTRTEVLVQRAMAALRHDRTSFVIAHRLSTIRDADVILVMESGHIVEQGTHDQLLAAGGAYERLYASQFAGVVAEEASSAARA